MLMSTGGPVRFVGMEREQVSATLFGFRFRLHRFSPCLVHDARNN